MTVSDGVSPSPKGEGQSQFGPLWIRHCFLLTFRMKQLICRHKSVWWRVAETEEGVSTSPHKPKTATGWVTRAQTCNCSAIAWIVAIHDGAVYMSHKIGSPDSRNSSCTIRRD